MTKADKDEMMSMNSRMKTFMSIYIILMLFVGNRLLSQEVLDKTSIRTAIGIGINEGLKETGNGLLYSVGWQKRYGAKSKLRMNPNLMIGSFSPKLISDVRDQYYRITTLDMNAHYDIVRVDAFSIVASVGGGINYSRGLLGTGGMTYHDRSGYFNTIYFVGNASLGFRIAPKAKKVAYVIRPINLQVGNKGFVLGYFSFGLDFKLQR
jgi:hypothetical protein